VFVTLGLLQENLGKYDLALREFQKVLDINPRDADALIGMAGVYEQMKRLPDAEATYKRGIALRPDYWTGIEPRGILQPPKRVQDSIAQYRRIIELTPDNSEPTATSAFNTCKWRTPVSGPGRSRISEIHSACAELSGLLKSRLALYAPEALQGVAEATRKALELNDRDGAFWSNLQAAYKLAQG